MAFDRDLLLVVVSSIAAMIVFGSVQTFRYVQKVYMESISQQHKEYEVEAYFILAIIYGIVSVFSWIAPNIVSTVGPKWSMIFGAITYIIWTVYAAAILTGIGSAIIWPALRRYIRRNSNIRTIRRNTMIFWVIFHLNTLIGDVYIFVEFDSATDYIDERMRTNVMLVLGLNMVFGMLVLILLPRRKKDELEILIDEFYPHPLATIRGMAVMFKTAKMSLLSIVFLYTGIAHAYHASIHGSCIAFTQEMPRSKRLLGLSAMAVTVGHLVGGVFQYLLTQKFKKFSSSTVFICGYVLHILAYLLSYTNLPRTCTFKDTPEKSQFISIKELTLLSSFLLGLGNSFIEAQVYSILSKVFAGMGLRVICFHEFVTNLGTTVAFVYAAYLYLHAQLAILLILGLLGTFSFVLVSVMIEKERDDMEMRRMSRARSRPDIDY